MKSPIIEMNDLHSCCMITQTSFLHHRHVKVLRAQSLPHWKAKHLLRHPLHPWGHHLRRPHSSTYLHLKGSIGGSATQPKMLLAALRRRRGSGCGFRTSEELSSSSKSSLVASRINYSFYDIIRN